MSIPIYWRNDEEDNTWSTEGNWNTQRDGGGSFQIPTTGNIAVFPSGNGSGCNLDIDISVDGLLFEDNYSGGITGSDSTYQVGLSGLVCNDNATSFVLDGTWSITGDLDLSTYNTFDAGDSHVVLWGTGDLKAGGAALSFYQLTINSNANYTINNGIIIDIDDIAIVLGTLNVDTSRTFRINANAKLNVGVGGALAGAGSCQFNFPGSGGMNLALGTITINETLFRSPTEDTIFAAGNYGNTEINYFFGGSSDRSIHFNAGDFNFQNLYFTNNNAGTYDMTVYHTGDAYILGNFSGDSGTYYQHDGNIFGSGSADQVWSFEAGGSVVTGDNIVLDKAGGSLSWVGDLLNTMTCSGDSDYSLNINNPSMTLVIAKDV